MLKTVDLLTLATMAMLVLGCNSSKTATGEVNFLAASEPGTLLLSAGGYGPNKNEAQANAERNAFQNLLFRGIPGSQYRLPMLADGEKTRRERPDYFRKLLDEAGYKAFMMQSEASSGFSLKKGGKNLTAKVKINVDALRRDLEANNIVRKFGL